MDISHLYHDAAFGDPTIELDVKEQLRTRIVNAREERNLEMLSRSYEKAKFICEKNTAWERWKVGQSLHGIWERSPQLDRSLAREKARVEELQRSILMKNFRKRHRKFPKEVKPKSPVSPVMRSVSNTTLDPIDPDIKSRKRRRQRRKAKKERGETDGLTQSITERHLQRPGDFARRTEHVVKSLAKLNWRQQNRRRDHEKFKEELKLHSKPVIERARVILKGRNDIDVETMMTDFENILLPHQRPEGNPNGTNHKHSKSPESSSMLTKTNILQLQNMNSSGSRSRLPSLTETPSSTTTELKTDGRNSSGDIANLSPDGTIASTSIKSTPHNVSKNTNSDGEVPKQDTEDADLDLQTNNHPLRPSQLPSLPHNNQPAKTSHADDLLTNTEKGIISPSRSRLRSINGGYECRRCAMGEVFSPSTSISQVILEEELDENTGGYKTVDLEATQKFGQVDDNNNVDPNTEIPTSHSKRLNENYTMTHTTGLPQLWKSSIQKKKEKAVPEISAAAIGRKHRKKRNESEKMW